MKGEPALIGKASRYLASARLLAEAGDLDSAVSRAYYAAFFVAQTLLDALELSFTSHQAVISAFGKEFAREQRLDPKFHRLLMLSFQKRQQADYAATTTWRREEVLGLIAEVSEFLVAAKAWLDERAS